MNQEIYKCLCKYLKDNNHDLDNQMFRAVLYSLTERAKGESAREANLWAYTFHLAELSGDPKDLKKQLSTLARNVWGAYNA